MILETTEYFNNYLFFKTIQSDNKNSDDRHIDGITWKFWNILFKKIGNSVIYGDAVSSDIA